MNGTLGSLPSVFRKMFLHLLHDSTFICFRNWLALQSLDMFSTHCITDFSLESRFDLIVVQFPNISYWFVMLGLNCNRSSIFIPSTQMHHHFGSWFTVSLSLSLTHSLSEWLSLLSLFTLFLISWEFWGNSAAIKEWFSCPLLLAIKSYIRRKCEIIKKQEIVSA